MISETHTVSPQAWFVKTSFRAFADHNYRIIVPLGLLIIALSFYEYWTSAISNQFVFELSDFSIYAGHCLISVIAFVIFVRVFRKHATYAYFGRTLLYSGIFSVTGVLVMSHILSDVSIFGEDTGEYQFLTGLRIVQHALHEEVWKLLSVILFVRVCVQAGVKNSVTTGKQYILMAATAGSGFAIVENFLYFGQFCFLRKAGEMTAEVATFAAFHRSFQPLHSVVTAMAARSIKEEVFSAAFSNYGSQFAPRTLSVYLKLLFPIKFVTFCKALILPTAIHAVFNGMLMLTPEGYEYFALALSVVVLVAATVLLRERFQSERAGEKPAGPSCTPESLGNPGTPGERVFV